MIQDYFSLDKKGNNYLLLRIINKVDFEEEVVWARDFSLSDRTGISKPIEQLMSYLKKRLRFSFRLERRYGRVPFINSAFRI